MTVAILLVATFAWMGITVMVFFLWRIARFYERSSGETAYSWLFLFAMVLLPIGAACYLLRDASFVGFPTGDLFLFAGGTFLLVASVLLQQVMMGNR